MNSFSNRLSIAIKQKGITQAELSRRTKIGRNSISDYLKGKYEAKQDNVYLLADALDVNEAWLMGMDAPMKKESIISIYDQLDNQHKKKVLNYAKEQLIEQNSTLPFRPKEEIDTLAAHSKNQNKKYTPEEIDGIKAYLDELSEEYDRKHR